MSDIIKIAHRGYSARYPENTMLAFEKAMEYGAHMIECDVRVTKDRVPVIIHDECIDRTSSGTGYVRDKELNELLKYSFHNGFPEFDGEKIPLLSDLLDMCRGKTELNLEIKEDNIIDEVLRTIEHTSSGDGVIISCFNHRVMAAFKERAPRIRRGLLYVSVWLSFLEELDILQPASVHPEIGVIDREQCLTARERGCSVYAWVGRNRKTVDNLRESGYVDGIMVNELSLFNPQELTS